jgi:hypothetical protein
LEEKPEGKIPLGRPRRRWKNGIRMEVRKIGWGDLWRAVVNVVITFGYLSHGVS